MQFCALVAFWVLGRRFKVHVRLRSREVIMHLGMRLVLVRAQFLRVGGPHVESRLAFFGFRAEIYNLQLCL